MDRGVEMNMSQAHINVQKHDFRGGSVPIELHGIAAVEAFKELGEGIEIMRPKEENVINKTQPEVGFLKSRVKEILFKETHEQVGIGGGHSCAYCNSLAGSRRRNVCGWMRINCVSWIRN